jgi:phytoene dehydrogenase-like protein
MPNDMPNDMPEDAQTRSGAVTRRAFLAVLAAAPLLPVAAPALVGLSPKGGRAITGGFVDDASAAGHRLRDRAAFATAREKHRVAVAIVGGGIGGLSAGWRLDALGVRDWTLLELHQQAGGNSRSGQNATSRYPWGAHYVPVPGTDAIHVRALFRELGVLGADGEWNERMLCHSPQERIFQHGQWHGGVEPFDALPRADRAQFAEFEKRIDEWRATGAFSVPSVAGQARGRSGKRAGAIAALDRQSAAAWMRAQGFTSPALRWWVEYGTRDDYGSTLESASAWAAVHYFAGRESEEIGPLTWPEGNDWIAKQLAARAGSRLRTGTPAVQVERAGTRWLVRTPRVDVECDAVIWASPLFVLPYVAPSVTLPVALEYAPWVVANLTLDRAPFERGVEPAWDNVIYGSRSLGYVDATHQSLGTRPERRVWTWYQPLVDRSPADGRRLLASRPWAAWRDDILADLARAHPDIAECVAHIDIMRWGHAMPRPVPGLLDRVERLRTWKPAERFYIAHSDMSGLSLFEEAQWHGVRAADAAARVVRG